MLVHSFFTRDGYSSKTHNYYKIGFVRILQPVALRSTINHADRTGTQLQGSGFDSIELGVDDSVLAKFTSYWNENHKGLPLDIELETHFRTNGATVVDFKPIVFGMVDKDLSKEQKSELIKKFDSSVKS